MQPYRGASTLPHIYADPGSSIINKATITAEGAGAVDRSGPRHPKLDIAFDTRTAVIFFAVLGLTLVFIAYNLCVEVMESGLQATNCLPFLLLGIDLFIAPGLDSSTTLLTTGSGMP